MTKEDIIRLAEQAAFHTLVQYDELFRFAALVAAQTKEACARVCEAEGQRIDASWSSCAEAIRNMT